MDAVERINRDTQIRSSNEAPRVLAERFGLSAAHVGRIRAAALRGPATRKDRYELEVIQGGWAAACMEADEWTDWVRQNPMGLVDKAFADRPCRDCPLGFAIDMRAEGRCNGMPSGTDGEPDEHRDEEDDVIESRPSGGGPGDHGARADATTLRQLPPRADLRPQDGARQGQDSRGQRHAAA